MKSKISKCIGTGAITHKLFNKSIFMTDVQHKGRLNIAWKVKFDLHLPHLSRRINYAFLMKICSLSVIIDFVVIFSHFHIFVLEQLAVIKPNVPPKKTWYKKGFIFFSNKESGTFLKVDHLRLFKFVWHI